MAFGGLKIILNCSISWPLYIHQLYAYSPKHSNWNIVRIQMLDIIDKDTGFKERTCREM